MACGKRITALLNLCCLPGTAQALVLITTYAMLQRLKAACNEAIGVLVARTGQTSTIWDRLLAAVVVAPSMQDDSAVGQYDISYQLAEIEVLSIENFLLQ